MKMTAWFIAFSVLLSLNCQQNAAKTSETPEKPPNVLLIISDDQAWNDYGFMGHPQVETPRIDQLASESLTFTHAYVAAPLCRPSLASMISGLYPHQHGITGNDPAFEFDSPRYQEKWREKRIPLNNELVQNFHKNELLTEILAEAGYQSLQTGKWWEGSWKSGNFSKGMTHGDPAKGGRHGDEGLKIGREGLQIIYDFIDTAQKANQPFFVWYAPFLPHAPHTPPKELEEKYLALAPTSAIARYWAMCEWFDQTCGDLLDFLENRDLDEETVVVYVCDNGWIQEPDKPNRYAPRSKRTPYEGGIRTPIMFKWPGKIAPLIDSTTLASSIDIVPTVLKACDLESSNALPGIDLSDESQRSQRKYIFSEAYDHDIANIKVPTQSLQYRIALNYPWKLIVPNTNMVPDASVELFNLARDPHELENLAEKQAERVSQMRQELDGWWLPE